MHPAEIKSIVSRACGCEQFDSVSGAAGKIRGEMRVNGFEKDQATFARVCGYVEQVWAVFRLGLCVLSRQGLDH